MRQRSIKEGLTSPAPSTGPSVGQSHSSGVGDGGRGDVLVGSNSSNKNKQYLCQSEVNYTSGFKINKINVFL